MGKTVTGKQAAALFTGEAVFTAAVEQPEGMIHSPFPEIAFIGRSNVGKSSLINALTRKKIARTSNTPGRTQALLFFRLADRMMLVDMPGYGYAEVSAKKQRSWENLIEMYLRDRQTLRRLVVLVDSRHGLKDSDRDFMHRLSVYAVPFVVVLTKIDKIHPKELSKVRDAANAEMKNYGCAWPEVFAVSSEKDDGVEELQRFLAGSAL